MLWVDISDLDLDAAQLKELMSDKWGVLGDPGSYYDTKDYLDYTGKEHHIRFNLATQKKLIDEAFDRIRKSFYK